MDYKIVVCGPPCGKTPFVKALVGEPLVDYTLPSAIRSLEAKSGYHRRWYRVDTFVSTHTLGVEVHPFLVKTKKGRIHLNFWDCGGLYTGMGEGYYIGASLALIFGSKEEQDSFARGLPPHVVQLRFDRPSPDITIDTIVQALR